MGKDNENRFLEFFNNNELLKCNALFKDKKMDQITFEAEGRTVKRIDNCIYSKKVRCAPGVETIRTKELG